MKLYPFQADGVSFLASKSRALLADEMGLGKTAQAVMAAIRANALKILIVCPASVKYGWAKEIDKWTGESSRIINRGKDKLENWKWTIINYDLLISKPILMQLLGQKWDILVLDEAHYLKNSRAKRTKAVYYPKGIADRVSRVWLLTGTPVLNRPIELFSHLKALVPDTLAPKYFSRYDFGVRFCDAYEGKWGWDESGASNTGELSELLSDFMLRRMKSDVIKDLPDKTYQTVFLSPTKNQKELTKKERTHETSQNTLLGETATLRRICGIEKIPQIVEHIKNVLEEKRKIVLFAYHRDVISELTRQLAAYKPSVLTGSTRAVERKHAVEKFRTEGDCRLFIGQIQAAGVGIDGLQDVSDTVIFAEMSYVPGQTSQAIDRCHRIGQKNKVLVQFIIAEGSIDEDIARSVSHKEKIIKQIVKKTKQKENDMNIEQELGRIADVLERIEAKLGAPLKMEEPKKTVVKRKSTKAVKTAVEPEADFGGGDAVAPSEQVVVAPSMTPDEFLKECNGKILAVTDTAKRTKLVKKLKAMFQADYGVASVKAIPADKVDECRAKFNKIMEG